MWKEQLEYISSHTEYSRLLGDNGSLTFSQYIERVYQGIHYYWPKLYLCIPKFRKTCTPAPYSEYLLLDQLCPACTIPQYAQINPLFLTFTRKRLAYKKTCSMSYRNGRWLSTFLLSF